MISAERFITCFKCWTATTLSAVNQRAFIYDISINSLSRLIASPGTYNYDHLPNRKDMCIKPSSIYWLKQTNGSVFTNSCSQTQDFLSNSSGHPNVSKDTKFDGKVQPLETWNIWFEYFTHGKHHLASMSSWKKMIQTMYSTILSENVE